MKTIAIIFAVIFSSSIYAQQDVDDILASNDLNTGKERQTMLLSQFNTLKADKLDGIYKLIADNGSLLEVRSFETGKMDGTWLQYDEEGNLLALASYKNDLKHGDWIIWNKNGVKLRELHYREGERTGTWKSWNENGELVSTKEY